MSLLILQSLDVGDLTTGSQQEFSEAVNIFGFEVFNV